MNRFEIRNILNAHKEHFRVLPTLAQNDLNGIIAEVDAEREPVVIITPTPVKEATKTPAAEFTTGVSKKKPAKKKAKKKGK